MPVDADTHLTALGNLHRAGNDRIEDADAGAVSEGLHDLFRVLRVDVCTGQQNAVDLQRGIQHTLRLRDRAKENIQPFRREVRRVTRNDYAVSGDERIERHQSKGGETVDQDVVILFPKGIQHGFENELAVGERGQSGADAGQLMVAGNEVHAFPVMEDGVVRVDGSIHNNSVHEGSEREMDAVQIMLAEADGQAALGVCVYEQDFLLSAGKTDAEVQSGRRLSDAALLVDDGNDFCVFHVGFCFLSFFVLLWDRFLKVAPTIPRRCF